MKRFKSFMYDFYEAIVIISVLVAIQLIIPVIIGLISGFLAGSTGSYIIFNMFRFNLHAASQGFTAGFILYMCIIALIVLVHPCDVEEV